MLIFTQNQYVLEDQDDCLDTSTEFQLPIKSGDVIKFIVDKDTVTYRGDAVNEIKIGLARCGLLVAENIGTIVDGDTQLYCTATIPANITVRDLTTASEITVLANGVNSIELSGDYTSLLIPGEEVRFETNLKNVFAIIDVVTYVSGTGKTTVTFTESPFNSLETGQNQTMQYGYYKQTIPINDCEYQLMFYSEANSFDCSQFNNSTLQSVIDSGVTLGDVLECTLNDFL